MQLLVSPLRLTTVTLDTTYVQYSINMYCPEILQQYSCIGHKYCNNIPAMSINIAIISLHCPEIFHQHPRNVQKYCNNICEFSINIVTIFLHLPRSTFTIVLVYIPTRIITQIKRINNCVYNSLRLLPSDWKVEGGHLNLLYGVQICWANPFHSCFATYVVA